MRCWWIQYLDEDSAGWWDARAVFFGSVTHAVQQRAEHLVNDFRVLGYVDTGLQTEYPRYLVEGGSGGTQQHHRQDSAYAEWREDRVLPVTVCRSASGVVDRPVQVQGKLRDASSYDVVRLKSAGATIRFCVRGNLWEWSISVVLTSWKAEENFRILRFLLFAKKSIVDQVKFQPAHFNNWNHYTSVSN